MGVADRVRQVVANQRELNHLVARVADLEADVEELRRHNLRLAELADLVEELLVPMAKRDDARVEAALEKFSQEL